MTVRRRVACTPLSAGWAIPLAVFFAQAAAAGPATVAPGNESYEAPELVCTLQDRRICEASGIVASRRNAGLFYIINDSGNEPLVFAVDRRGKTHCTIRLANAQNVDWEDLALAPGDHVGAWDVCVPDIGDNRAVRDNLVIYRFPEPDLSAAPDELTVEPTAFPLTYETGASDAEAFVVHPASGDGYVFTKQSDGHSRILRLTAPWKPGQRARLELIGELKFPPSPPIGTIVTAADLSPDGRRLAVRTYLCGWEWEVPERGDVREFQQSLERKPAQVTLAAEPQGEALCYDRDGAALLTVSEQVPTSLYECRRESGGSKPR